MPLLQSASDAAQISEKDLKQVSKELARAVKYSYIKMNLCHWEKILF